MIQEDDVNVDLAFVNVTLPELKICVASMLFPLVLIFAKSPVAEVWNTRKSLLPEKLPLNQSLIPTDFWAVAVTPVMLCKSPGENSKPSDESTVAEIEFVNTPFWLLYPNMVFLN